MFLRFSCNIVINPGTKTTRVSCIVKSPFC